MIKIFISINVLLLCISSSPNTFGINNTQYQTAQYSNDDAGTTVIKAEDYEPEMATGMRSNGMIWVVVGVIIIILGGLIFYLTTLDRKISKLEKEFNHKI